MAHPQSGVRSHPVLLEAGRLPFAMGPPDSLKPFEIEIQVDPSDIDQLGHVNNVVYLRWVQDAATAHWYATATAEQKAALFWVVTRHEIDYKRPAFEGDAVIARTWVGQAAGRRFERHTELIRKADGKLLAKARTLWAPVDKTTKRRAEVGPEVYAMFST